MSDLRKELKQKKPFRSLEHEAYLNLQHTAYLLRSEIVGVIKPFDLTEAQYNVLRILRGAGENGLQDIEVRKRLIIKDADTLKLFDCLEDRNFLLREKASLDEQVVIVKITSKGLMILSDLDEPIFHRNQVILGHLGEDLLEQFNALLVLARKRSGLS